MKMKKSFKTVVAIIALMAMLLEDTYSIAASMNGEVLENYAENAEENSKAQTDTSVEKNDDCNEAPDIEVEGATPLAEDVSEKVNDEANPIDDLANNPQDYENDINIVDSDTDANLIEEPIHIGDTNKDTDNVGVISASIDAFQDRIESNNVSEITLYVNTDQMLSKDSFRLDFEGAEVKCDALLNTELSKSEGGIYNVVVEHSDMVRIKAVKLSEGLSVQYSIRQDGNPQIKLISQDEAVLDKSLVVCSNGNEIKGVGYEAVNVNFDSSKLSLSNSFDLHIMSDEQVTCNGDIVTDNVVKNILNTKDSFHIASLNNEPFAIYVDGDVLATYKVNSVPNGSITIVLADAVETENASDVKRFDAFSSSFAGTGYDKLSFSISCNSGNVSDNNVNCALTYDFYVESESEEVTVNGKSLTDNRITLDGSINTVNVSGLNKEAFKIYVDYDNDADLDIAYEVSSLDDGTGLIEFNFAKDGFVKKVYEYEDSKVYIEAVLSDAASIPDSASLKVTEVTAESGDYNYGAYMEALNNNAEYLTEEQSEGVNTFNESNTLLYDIAFIGEEDGNVVEYQPEEGTVKVSIRFKNNQLTEQLNAEADSDITIIHLPLAEDVKSLTSTTAEATDITAADIYTDVVADSASISSETADFTLRDFSVTAVYSNGQAILKPGPSNNYKSVLNKAVYYGLVANSMSVGGHMDTNLAVGTLEGSANVTAGAYTGDNNPGNFVVGDYISNGIFFESNKTGKPFVLFTTQSSLDRMNTKNMSYNTKGVVYNTDHSKSELQNYVKGLVSGVSSAELSALANTYGYDFEDIVVENKGKYYLDITASGEGTFYINVNNSVKNPFSEADKLKIRKNENQIIVFNILNTDITMHKFSVDHGKGYVGSDRDDSSVDEYARTIIFNMPNAKNVNISSGVFGVYIAPKAYVKINATSTGWLVADSAKNGGEWHCVWTGMPSPEATYPEISFSATKTVNGSTPSADENKAFTFKLEKKNSNGSWTVVDTVKNEGSMIKFNPVKLEGTGTFTFRVSESEGVSGYIKDTTIYTANVVVTKSTSSVTSDDGITAAAISDYKITSVTYSNGKSNVNAMTFNNIKEGGTLIVRKKVAYVTNANQFYFKVKNSAGEYIKNGSSKVWTINADATVTISDLPYDTYKIVECDSNGNELEQNKPYAITYSSLDQKIVIDDNNPKEFTITNALGNLIVKKVVNGNISDKKFYFTVKDEKGAYVKNGSSNIWSVSAGKSVTINDVSYGKYTVTETDSDGNTSLEDAKYIVSYSNNGAVVSKENPTPVITITNTEKGSVELTKVDSNGSIISGVVFSLYRRESASKSTLIKTVGSNGSYECVSRGTVSELVTDENGKLKVSNLPVGDYYFVELSAPSKYIMATGEVGGFTIDAKGGKKEVKVVNGNFSAGVTFRKVDADDIDKGLEGTAFDLYYMAQNAASYTKLGAYYADNNGYVTIENGLQIGDYYFVETKAVDGYETTDEKYSFTIDANASGKIVNINNSGKLVTIKNNRKPGKVLLKKYDDTKSELLNGAKFDLYSTNPSTAWQKLTSNFNNKTYYKYGEYTVNGSLTVENLPWGDYFFVETEAPSGYVTDTETKYSFRIGKKSSEGIILDAGVIEAFNTPDTGSIQLIKYGEEKDALKGASFKLYRNGSLYSDTVYVTNENGEIKVSGLPYGTYYFVEVKAPVEYVTPLADGAKTASVVIDENTAKDSKNKSVEYLTIEFTNKKKYGSLELQKVDDKGNNLAGATFYLVKVENGNEKNVKLEGSDGVYEYNKIAGSISTKQVVECSNTGLLTVNGLPYGVYRVYEDEAPKGYKIKDGYLEFDITEDGEYKTYNFENTLIQAGVKFLKVDASQKVLANAKFHLYKKVEDTFKDTGDVGTSDDKGIVLVNGLGAGEYFFKEYSREEYQAIGSELAGYADNSKNEYSFRITADDNGKIVTINSGISVDGMQAVVNTPLEGKVKLFKYTTVNGEKVGLKDVVFGLYDNKDKLIKKISSDENGYVYAENLPWGQYYFKELETSSKMILDSKSEYHFEINALNVPDEVFTDIDGKALEVENKPIYGSAKLVKKDSTSNEKIEGVTFALYNANDNSVVSGYEKLVTDVNGVIETNKNLEAGKYYFKEIDSTDDYYLNNSQFFFEINQSNMDETVLAKSVDSEEGVAYNKPVPGNVELFKYEVVSGKRSGLSGAEFKLYKEDKAIGFIPYSTEVDTYTTDANGVISASNLEWGTYYFKEITPPTGYEKNEEKIEFVIGKGQLDYTGNARLSISNTRKYGSIKLVKKYSVNDEVKGTLEGAKFSLYQYVNGKDDIKIPSAEQDGLYTTDKNGEILVGNLEWGSYYFYEEETKGPDYALPTIRRAPANGFLVVDASTAGIDNPNESDLELYVEMVNAKIRGNVELVKYDDSNPANALAGAYFKLYDEAGNEIGLKGKNGVYTFDEKATEARDEKGYIVDNAGKLVVKQLPYGNYYFYETVPPKGYNINPNKVEFSIKDNQKAEDEPQIKVSCIDSEVSAGVEFYKTYTASTNEEKALSGVVFELFKVGALENGSDLSLGQVTSDINGKVSKNGLSSGKYYFVEISVPNDAYEMIDNRLSFTINDSDNGKIVELEENEGIKNNTVVNAPKKGAVKLVKVFTINGSKSGVLEGATFDLRRTVDDSLVTTKVTDANGEIEVKNLLWGDYYFIETSAPNGYDFDENKKYGFTIDESNVLVEQFVEASNARKPGKIELEKIDNIDSAPLSGVVFELYKDYGTDNQTLVSTLTTVDGRAQKEGLLFGNYTLLEKSSIEGYVKNDNRYDFVIDGDNLSAEFTGSDAIVNNRVQGYVELLKKNSETNQPVADVQFDLYSGDKTNGKYVASYVTNKEGYLVMSDGSRKIGPLDYGEYYFLENVPKGYSKDDTDLSFKIQKNEQVVYFTGDRTVYNTPVHGGVMLRKTDENGKPLANAEFTLYASTPANIGQTVSSLFNDGYVKYGVYYTDNAGKLLVSDLPWDNYYFIETKAPSGYSIIDADKKYGFEINKDNCSDGQVIDLGTVKNAEMPGSIILTKVDSETNEPIEGVSFKLFKKEETGDVDVSALYGANAGVFRTSAEGVIKVENVAWGTYYFEEVQAADLYEAITDTYKVKSAEVTINELNVNEKTHMMEPKQVVVKNNKGYGYVSLKKVFDGEQPGSYAGVRFALVDDTNSKTIGEYETDADSMIKAEVIGGLTYGDYHFEELSVPSDVSYSVSPFKLSFTIDKSNSVAAPIELTFTNSEVRASAQLKKTDALTKQPLSGIRFNVYDSLNDKVAVTSVVSDENGIVKVESLPMGSYYFLEDSKSAAQLGYVADDSKYYFEITPNDKAIDGEEQFVTVYGENTQDAVTVVENSPANGTIELVKTGKSILGNITKLDITDAEFELYKDGSLYYDSTELKKYINGSSVVVNNLPWGTYYFKEIKAPAGYVLPASAETNSVVIDGFSVSDSITTPLTCSLCDDSIRVYISKRRIAGTEELPGAQLSIYEADSLGNKLSSELLSWTSNDAARLIEVGGELSTGLVSGKYYLVHEDAAPQGYSMTSDILFRVNEDGTVTTDARVSGSSNGMTIIMEDAPIGVSISKREMGTSIELTGAVLGISDGNNVIDSWISNGQKHVIEATLEVGKSYTLEEISAPKGYYTAEPITFAVNYDGSIKILKDSSASAEIESSSAINGNSYNLVMYDRPICLEVSKKRLTGGEQDYVAGAELALYEQNGDKYELISTWTSPENGAFTVDSGLLSVGNKYKIVETKVPAGYSKSDDLYFTIKDYSDFTKTDSRGRVIQKEVVLDAPINTVFSKRSVSTEDELEGAVLQIIDDDNSVLCEFTTSDKQTIVTSIESVENMSDNEKEQFAGYNVVCNVKLVAGKSYRLHEVFAPNGYALADDVSFKVLENGLTTPVIIKDKPLEIKLSKKDISNNAYLPGASLQLIDGNNQVVAEWISGNKPVLLTLRNVEKEEAALYSEVIPVLLPSGMYKLHEVSAPSGYEIAEDVNISIDGACVKADNGDIREETMYDYKAGTTIFTGDKEWIAPRNSDGQLSPDFTYPEIKIELYRDSVVQGEMDKTPIKSVTLKNGTTNFMFGNLPKYRLDGGKNYEYTYTAVEVMPDYDGTQYTCIPLQTTKTDDGLTTKYHSGFVNTVAQEFTDLSVSKKFLLKKDDKGNIIKDISYDDVTIYLLQNGKRVDVDGDGKEEFFQIKNAALDSEGVVSYDFAGLPRYDLATGNEYKYEIEEAFAQNYSSVVTYGNMECQIINTPKDNPVSIRGKKVWVDPDGSERPDITIQLFRDGKLYKETKLSADNTFAFDSLYEYNLGYGNDEGDNPDTADGHRFVYEIKEIGATGYDIAIEYSGDQLTFVNGVADVTITNTITQKYISVDGTKHWDDAGNYTTRPEITINLYATDTAGRNHEVVDTIKIPNTNTSYSFGTDGRIKLPMYDKNGKVIKYEVEEEKLSGYISTVSGNDFYNTPSKVRISKLDATNREELPGAVLALCRKGSSDIIDKWTSTEVPHYIEALEIGADYVLTEESAPVGYVLAEPIEFTVSSNGIEQKVEMLDDPIIGSVELTKADATTRENLAGAEFILYSADGTRINVTGKDGEYVYSEDGFGTDSLKVSKKGLLTVDELPYGSYYFKESKAPAGYELTKDEISFSIVDDGVNVSVTCLDTRVLGSVTLVKVSDDTGETLQGAEFELYCKTPKTTGQAAASTIYSDAYYRYGTYTTDENGKIAVDNLPWDSYYFVETKAPEGYEISKDVNGDSLCYSFTVDGSNADESAIELGRIGNKKTDLYVPPVLGERRPEIVSDVLGVRAAPTEGVLGERVGPATGDTGKLILWILLLASCLSVLVVVLRSKKYIKKK